MNNTNAEIWSKERSIDTYVAKLLFPQVYEGFRLASYTTLVLVSDDTKIFKLILCFSILLL